MDNMKKIYLLITMALALFSQGIWAQAVSQTFNASGTYTVPSGYNAIVVIEVWGAGGGGDEGNNTNGSRGGGGGGGYARFGTTLSAGSFTVTVGAGGLANPAGTATGGGTSSFAALAVATGGGAPTATTVGGVAGAGTTGTVLRSGGAGGIRLMNFGGGGGGGSATASANGGVGGTGANPTGGAGGTGQGVGGAGGNTNAVGVVGNAPGAGGGGKGDGGTTSGNGAAGRVVVTVTSSGPLPIKVYYLNGAKDNNGNTLNWKAECSSTEAIFEIERSDDGRRFATINTIVASQLRCLQPFNYSDNNIIAGTTYYRIKIIDTDGKITYSSIIKLGGSQQKEMMLVRILPNPVSNIAQLNITTIKKDNVELAILSLEGKVMYKNTVQLQAGSSNISLDVSKLSKGTYFVRGVFTDGQTNSIKLIKQ
jgi:Secretion system C-terminal sorting domain